MRESKKFLNIERKEKQFDYNTPDVFIELERIFLKVEILRNIFKLFQEKTLRISLPVSKGRGSQLTVKGNNSVYRISDSDEFSEALPFP